MTDLCLIYLQYYAFSEHNEFVLFKSAVFLLTAVFHGFGQAKFPDGGLVLESSQFSILLPAASKNKG